MGGAGAAVKDDEGDLGGGVFEAGDGERRSAFTGWKTHPCGKLLIGNGRYYMQARKSLNGLQPHILTSSSARSC